MKSYSSLPAGSEESHYEYAYSHQDVDITGYVNPIALHTDGAPVKYDTIKDNLTGCVDYDNVDNRDGDKNNYLEIIDNMGTLDTCTSMTHL